MRKKREGGPLAETADMKAWKKNFDNLSMSDHEEKLKRLGLDEEDIEEFKEDFKAKKKKIE